ncbi:DUF922 domain-containing protein [uncultured Cohaesibacter sp.]|uniref:DUF922 domain-containing protein n=1 Tax=uncultured Cohaesibacter sp. TaxID=1002546 RepID=UPI0029C8847F|nr:DUF922 domain-containing protein [uncultured Cohaesibacter sp.]
MLCFAAFLFSPPADARVRVSNRTEVRDYRVHGETAGELVSYMKRRPFRGDYGPAMANIRPRYTLRTATSKTARGCRISELSLDIRFIMTLPKAIDSHRHSSSTRQAWRGFRAFAKRHEEGHRKIYLSCARRYASKVLLLPPTLSCSSIERQARRMLREQEKACDIQHHAFDRREFRRVPSLSLFRQARQERGRLYQRASQRRLAERKQQGFGRKASWFPVRK